MMLRANSVPVRSTLLVLLGLSSLWLSAVGRASQEPAATEVQPAPSLVWKDAETGETLFTIDDVLAFDWDNQVFLLELDAALDFLAWMVPHRYQSRELLVEDEEGLIYRGRWVNRISSMGFFGPVYDCVGMSRYFRINGGYPGSLVAGSADVDMRYAPRLYAALESRGVLYEPKPYRDYTGLKIDRVHTEWRNCGQDLKIRVEFFPDTFRVGREARAHVFFAGGPHGSVPDIDFLRIEIKFVTDWGQYRSDVQIDAIPAKMISDGIYVCRFRPWTPCPGSRPSVMEAGTGYISLSVLLCRQVESGVQIVRRLDFGEQSVDVQRAPGHALKATQEGQSARSAPSLSRTATESLK